MRRKEAVKPVTQWTIIAASLMKALHIVLNRNTTETQQKSCDNKRQLCFYLKKTKKNISLLQQMMQTHTQRKQQ